MAKKKASPVVYYTPPTSVQEVKDIINEKIEQIPQYEDSGVKYQGKYKIQKSANTWELKAQESRWYGLFAANSPSTNTQIPRAANTLKFYCTRIIVYFWSNAVTPNFTSNAYTIEDDVNGQSAIKFLFFPTQTVQNITFDFTDSPRKFEGQNFNIYQFAGCPATGHIYFLLYGWLEQN